MLDSSSQDNDLLLKLSEGNQQAFEKLYRLYSPGLISNLLKMVKSEVQAKEILQEVFIKIWEHRSSINSEKSFRSYLFKIAENKAYDFFRKATRDMKMEAQLIALSSNFDTESDEFKVKEEHLALLHMAIDSLPPQRKQIYRLCKLEGKSYKEASEILGISVTTINDHIVKGTKSIRQYFDDHDKTLSVLLVIWITQ